jgi:hypothetical protein
MLFAVWRVILTADAGSGDHATSIAQAVMRALSMFQKDMMTS